MTLLPASGLDYLNTLRQKTGLKPFAQQKQLQTAAKNHSDYMQSNHVSGHYEDSGDEGFTGIRPVNRVLYAGYPARYVLENVSSGTPTVEESVDGLFSAIYHRFGFLSPLVDEIGIGISPDERFYTYDMGNSTVADLCLHGTYETGDYYTGVCADASRRIESDTYLNAVNGLKEDAPDLIVWPTADSTDIPPVFYEESPDPLPSHSVTGYPVSVEFNDAKFSEPPTLRLFSLEDASGSTVRKLVLMDKDNDPNHEFSGYQFALFPKNRLEWGSMYFAKLTYGYDGSVRTKRWCFSTRSLRKWAERVYRIEDERDAALEVVSGVRYAVYVVPEDTNDRLGRVSYSYDTSISFDFIDQNTFTITLTGEAGGHADLSFSNGQKIRLTIAQTDTASEPQNATCIPLDTSDNQETQTSDGNDENGAAEPEENENPEETGATDSSDQTAKTPTGSGTNGEPGSVILVEEGTSGTYRTLDTDTYAFDENDTHAHAAILENGGIEYHVRTVEGNTSVLAEKAGGEIRIDHRGNTLVTPSPERSLTVEVGPNGHVRLRIDGKLRPKTELPPGTRVEIEENRIRTTIPLPDRVVF